MHQLFNVSLLLDRCSRSYGLPNCFIEFSSSQSIPQDHLNHSLSPFCHFLKSLVKNTCSSRFPAAAGTALCRSYSIHSFHFLLQILLLVLHQPSIFASSLLLLCWIKLPLIVQYSPLLYASILVFHLPLWPFILSNRQRFVDF